MSAARRKQSAEDVSLAWEPLDHGIGDLIARLAAAIVPEPEGAEGVPPWDRRLIYDQMVEQMCRIAEERVRAVDALRRD